ncbi:MAG: glycosyltransferase [Candidatus Sumerlaeota bacterium]|nr:glycosyltransferase [Candidatus Sumerlaeota bacterium]
MATPASVICTVYNEAESIGAFLDSLARQSRVPDEIVIVDGGSTDATVEIIRASRAPVRLVVDPECNRRNHSSPIAHGRNVAIANAQHNLIACCDAGCRIEPRWLEEILAPLERDPSIDVVAGWYEPDAQTAFERCLAALTFPALEEVRPDGFLPSSRSVAFRRSAWEAVGGYPELFYVAEDTLFDLNLKKRGLRFAFAPKAVVRWRPRPNWTAVWRQEFLYAEGNGRCRIKLMIYLALIGRYAVAAAALAFGRHWTVRLGLPLLSVFFYRSFLRIPGGKPRFWRDRAPLWRCLAMQLWIDAATLAGWVKGRFFCR